jgi:hypothetical protein
VFLGFIAFHVMKNLFYLFSVGFMVTTSVGMSHAQTMMIGVRAGVNLANEAYTNLPTGESISGRTLMLAGGQFDYWFSHSWAMSLQFLYNQKGAHADAEMTNYIFVGPTIQGTSTADWTTSYLEIPLLAKFSFGNGAVRPYVFEGPSIGFLLSNVEKLHFIQGNSIPNGVGIIYTTDTTANISDSTARIDFSIVAGAGILLTLGSGMQLFLDASYAFGLNNTDGYSWDKAYGISVYSRDIRIAAGVLFPIN